MCTTPRLTLTNQTPIETQENLKLFRRHLVTYIINNIPLNEEALWLVR
jgi:hypothetical protein